jgi:hypothetical protein
MSIPGKATEKSASATPKPGFESEEDDSDFSGGGRKHGKRRRAAIIKSDGEEPSLLRISARSGKATNYNEDDRYLGMISDSEDEQIAAYANQPTITIGGADSITNSLYVPPLVSVFNLTIMLFSQMRVMQSTRCWTT